MRGYAADAFEGRRADNFATGSVSVVAADSCLFRLSIEAAKVNKRVSIWKHSELFSHLSGYLNFWNSGV